MDGKSETESLWGWYHSMAQRKGPGSARDDVLLVHMSGCAAGLTVGVRTSAPAVVIPLQEQHLYENHKKENNKNENERTEQNYIKMTLSQRRPAKAENIHWLHSQSSFQIKMKKIN